MLSESYEKNIRALIKECLGEMLCERKDFVIDEMAYPISFDFEKFKSIRSFTGKQKYAKQHLLGKVGVGSSRAVFKIDDEKVIKIAMNDKGVSQNSVEAEGHKQKYDVAARVFDVDHDYMWIEMELAKPLNEKRFKELTGAFTYEVERWLTYMRGERDKEGVRDLSENEFAEEMREFVEDFQYPVPGDFGRTSTYGEVLRNGEPRVVIVDFGFDKSTEEIYSKSN